MQYRSRGCDIGGDNACEQMQNRKREKKKGLHHLKKGGQLWPKHHVSSPRCNTAAVVSWSSRMGAGAGYDNAIALWFQMATTSAAS